MRKCDIESAERLLREALHLMKILHSCAKHKSRLKGRCIPACPARLAFVSGAHPRPSVGNAAIVVVGLICTILASCIDEGVVPFLRNLHLGHVLVIVVRFSTFRTDHNRAGALLLIRADLGPRVCDNENAIPYKPLHPTRHNDLMMQRMAVVADVHKDIFINSADVHKDIFINSAVVIS